MELKGHLGFQGVMLYVPIHPSIYPKEKIFTEHPCKTNKANWSYPQVAHSEVGKSDKKSNDDNLHEKQHIMFMSLCEPVNRVPKSVSAMREKHGLVIWDGDSGIQSDMLHCGAERAWQAGVSSCRRQLYLCIFLPS